MSTNGIEVKLLHLAQQKQVVIRQGCMKTMQYLWLLAILMESSSASAIDAERLQRYQTYKAQQKATQGVELEQARTAIQAGDLKSAQRHLDIARQLAYAPDEVGAVERQLAETRERLAREERERQERIAQEARERQARIAAANAASSNAAAAAIESSLDWNYNYNEVYVPPVYETRLRERGIWFKEYSLETSQKYAGFTSSTLDKVYFSVRLRNPASHAVQVTYKIKAREQFSVGKALGNTTKAGFWGVMVGIAAAGFTGSPDAGVAVGALAGGAKLMSQGDENQWFEKEKTFTVKLDAGGVTYETGSFPVNKHLSQSPTLEIVSVR